MRFLHSVSPPHHVSVLFFSLPSHTHQKRFEENMGNLMLAYLCFAFTKPGGHS